MPTYLCIRAGDYGTDPVPTKIVEEPTGYMAASRVLECFDKDGTRLDPAPVFITICHCPDNFDDTHLFHSPALRYTYWMSGNREQTRPDAWFITPNP